MAFQPFPRLLLGCLLGVALVGIVRATEGGLAGEPLAARSRPEGTTLFTELSPERTGVVTVNDYADPRMWGDRYQEFALGGFGTGVAIGDYDSDGRPDLFVVSKTESSRLFRNLGDFRFEDVTEAAGLAGAAGGWVKRFRGWVGLENEEEDDPVEAWKQGATFADVNNDGHLDLYICRFGRANRLYINQGDGTFVEEAEERGLAVVDASGMGAFCDYDRDGWLDVYIQTNMLDAKGSPEGQEDYLFRNRGDGTFENVTRTAGIYGPTLAHSATWWDFDNDGWPDLYLANDFGGADRLYRNIGDGTFRDVIHEVVPVMPYSSMGADLGDVDNDGLIDFLVADMAVTSHERDQRGMASSRELSREDGDSAELAPQFPRNALYLNTGLGRVLEAAYLAGLSATDWTWSVRFEDLDNDGRIDLFVTNGMNREYQNADLRERIILAESLEERMRLMQESPPLSERNLAFRNLGDLRFEPNGPEWGLDYQGVSFGTAFGDLDGDGDLDLIFSNYQAGVTVLRNDGMTGNRIVIALRGRQSNRHGIGATVRIETASGLQVRPLVLARGYLSSSEPVCHFGVGGDEQIRRLTVDWPSGHRQVFNDLPVNRRFVLTEPDGPPAPPRRDRPRKAGLFEEVGEAVGLRLPTTEEPLEGGSGQPLVPFRFERRGPAVAVGDLNGDGRDDIVLAGTSAEPPRIGVSDTSGRFRVVEAPWLSSDPSVSAGPLLIFDLDGDGDGDLLVTRAGARMPAGSTVYQPALFLNDGGGGFKAAPAAALPPLPLSCGSAIAADIDRDGRPDLFLGARLLAGQYPASPRSALLLNRGGRFDDVTDRMAPGLAEAGMVNAAVFSDVDGDGWVDLLVAHDWGGVRYWRNRSGEAFEDRTEAAGFSSAGSGWWSALAAGDFNRDGILDYAAGNVGLNTAYSFKPGRAARIYHGAFTRRRSKLLIEAYEEEQNLYPRRTFKALAAEIPALRRRFRSNDDYARATLDEILGPEPLAAADLFMADEFRSGVFLSQPDGTFAFEAFPRIAQIAPIGGLVAGDFDGDGLADLIAVQNLHAPIPYVGRFTGGLGQFLRGDGHGGFKAVPPGESGLIVPGDAKAVAVLGVDGSDGGWPGIFVSRNDSTTLLFRPTGESGGPTVITHENR